MTSRGYLNVLGLKAFVQLSLNVLGMSLELQGARL